MQLQCFQSSSKLSQSYLWHHPASCCVGPLINSWGNQAFNGMSEEHRAAFFVQLSLTKDCLCQSVGQQVPSPAVRTAVPVRRRPNPKGWGVQCAGIWQEVSKSVRGFSNLALFGPVKMGKSFSWGSGRAWSVAGQSSRGSCTFSSPSLTSLSNPEWSWNTSGIPRALQHSAACSCSCACEWRVRAGRKGRGQRVVTLQQKCFPEVTVKMTPGDSALCPSLSDKTLLSLQVKRWFF